ncbi:GNAT family N-acetyltransferase [Frondihabitans sp. PAMC 28766]|uniref:GNAT family N-acetyltransferase n=1 Tax=Frondihabitans sp. PAMC 28766 TaxID=1795630 RepID=UPI0012FF86AC|nr:GNAT family N-acetyltransferase [Frondihabitans sp. PAMC 28766]
MPSDVEDVFRIYSDPATWKHSPHDRFTSREQAVRLVGNSQRSHGSLGLGTWAIRLGDAGLDARLTEETFVGTGGALFYEEPGIWNLGYRLAPEAWGRGFGTELAEAAVVAAGQVAPHIPVTARVLTNNPRSVRVLEKVGLKLLWEGPTKDERPAEERTPPLRRIYADRRLPAHAFDWLIDHA